MGMLHEIVQVLSNIDKTADIGELKRKIIEHCIYGVDIEHSAVEIAKLSAVEIAAPFIPIFGIKSKLNKILKNKAESFIQQLEMLD